MIIRKFLIFVAATACAIACHAQDEKANGAITSDATMQGIGNDSVKPDETFLRLSRQECIRIGLDKSPTIKISDLEVKRMEYAKNETRGGLFPTIDFQGVYQRAIELQTIRMNMGGQSQSLKMGSDNTWNLGFTTQMPLVAPTLWKAISISKTQILAQLESARESRLNLINEINKSYYALLLANASREVIQKNYDRALLNADIYKKQFEVGAASEYDVLRSSVQVTNIEPELLQADIAVRQCELALKVLMSIDYEVKILPDTTLAEMQKEMYGYALGAEGDLSGNASLRQLDIQSEIARKNVDLKKFAWIPTLGVSYGISWTSLSNGNAFKNQQFNPYSNVSLALNVPIFSGGSKYYALKQAKVQVNELQLQRENLLMSLKMQRDLALDNIRREASQIESSRRGMESAGKAYDIMQKSFEIGAASYLDLRDSELANTSAQLSYYQAIYNYLVSSSELDLLLGKEEELSIGKVNLNQQQ